MKTQVFERSEDVLTSSFHPLVKTVPQPLATVSMPIVPTQTRITLEALAPKAHTELVELNSREERERIQQERREKARLRKEEERQRRRLARQQESRYHVD